jgi:hypothetical protein
MPDVDMPPAFYLTWNVGKNASRMQTKKTYICRWKRLRLKHAGWTIVARKTQRIRM